MQEIRVAALGLLHLGSHVVVHVEHGARPYAGLLIDVVHRPSGPSWLWFAGFDVAVVLVVDEPAQTAVVLEPSSEEESVAIPHQRLPRRQRRRVGRGPAATSHHDQRECVAEVDDPGSGRPRLTGHGTAQFEPAAP